MSFDKGNREKRRSSFIFSLSCFYIYLFLVLLLLQNSRIKDRSFIHIHTQIRPVVFLRYTTHRTLEPDSRRYIVLYCVVLFFLRFLVSSSHGFSSRGDFPSLCHHYPGREREKEKGQEEEKREKKDVIKSALDFGFTSTIVDRERARMQKVVSGNENENDIAERRYQWQWPCTTEQRYNYESRGTSKLKYLT